MDHPSSRGSSPDRSVPPRLREIHRTLTKPWDDEDRAVEYEYAYEYDEETHDPFGAGFGASIRMLPLTEAWRHRGTRRAGSPDSLPRVGRTSPKVSRELGTGIPSDGRRSTPAPPAHPPRDPARPPAFRSLPAIVVVEPRLKPAAGTNLQRSPAIHPALRMVETRKAAGRASMLHGAQRSSFRFTGRPG